MAFGGFFGGGSSNNNNNNNDKSTDSSTQTEVPTAQSVFPPSPMSSTSSSSASSSEIKNRLTTAISTQSNILNARILISKINENCFDHCVTAPGSSLSSKENQCLSACMEKYIDGWNAVSRTYVSRLQREGAQIGLGGGAGGL